MVPSVDGFLSEMWNEFVLLLSVVSHARVLTSFCSNPAATWQVFKCTVQSYPRDAAMQQIRAMPPLGLLRRRGSLTSVSSTFPAPTFTAASFSLSRVPPGRREEGTLSQVMRAVHLGVERERVRFFSLVAAGRREGAPWPWGQFPDLLLRSLFLAILLAAKFAFWHQTSPRFLPLLVVFRPRERTYRYRQPVCPRAREFQFSSDSVLWSEFSSTDRRRTFSGVHVPWN